MRGVRGRTALRGPSAPQTAAIREPVAPAADSRAAAAAAEIRAICARYGLDATLLASLLTRAGVDRVDVALSYTFGETTRVPPLRQMARLVRGISRLLELDEPLAVDLRSTGRRLVGTLREVITGVIFLLCVWFVVGGIVTGQNSTANATSPAFTLVVLGLSLGCLALLEAAHIGAVALSGADVSELRSSHPRVFRLHPFIATKERLEHYLAGRQAGVVLVVFAVAEVTRTSGMHVLPGTGIGLPGFTALAFQIGVPGALMVLVIGQVAPQLVTARRPAAMMNTAPMAVAFQVTRGIAQLGLANPARWFVGWSSATERIPSAAKERYDATTQDVTGHGVDTLRRHVRVRLVDSLSETRTTTAFHRGGLPAHTLEIASTTLPPSTSAARAHLLRGGERSEVVVIRSETVQNDAAPTYRVIETLAPRLDTFQPADELRTTFEATVPMRLELDMVHVTATTRLVVLHVVLEHPPAPLPPARLVVTDANGHVTESGVIPPVVDELDGAVEFIAFVRYPALDSVITLRWGSFQ